jgi:hypothetical protein
MGTLGNVLKYSKRCSMGISKQRQIEVFYMTSDYKLSGILDGAIGEKE